MTKYKDFVDLTEKEKEHLKTHPLWEKEVGLAGDDNDSVLENFYLSIFQDERYGQIIKLQNEERKRKQLPKLKVFKVIRNKEGGSKYETGHLIDGIEFEDGTVVIRWRSEMGSTAIYKNWKDFHTIHIGDHKEYNSEVVILFEIK